MNSCVCFECSNLVGKNEKFFRHSIVGEMCTYGEEVREDTYSCWIAVGVAAFCLAPPSFSFLSI